MSAIFPAIYSTLSPTALAEYIAETYGLADTRCKLLVRGVGDTYLVETAGPSYILRVYRGSHRTLPQIRQEVTLLQACCEKGVSVSYPVADKMGGTVRSLPAIEGTRHAVLFTYAQGQVVRQLSETQLINLGEAIASYHDVASAITMTNTRWVFDVDTTLTRPLEILAPYFADNQADYVWLKEKAVEAEVKIRCVDTAIFTMGYCHYDLLPKNFHFEGDQVTLFDFDFMGHGWLANDLMVFWQHLWLDVYTNRMKQEDAEEAYKTFIAAYRRHRWISEEELGMVPYLALGFWLFYMAFHTTHDQFTQFTQPGHQKMYVGIIRFLVDKHWSKA